MSTDPDRPDPEEPSAAPDPSPSAGEPAEEAPRPEAGERIAKALSRAGVASRRDAERMVLAGRVRVNGAVVASPATDVRPGDRIEVDGELVPPPEATRLWLYHKPAGLVTTERDEEGRPTVFDNLPEDLPRVMSIGRLDLSSEGLLLLTNDGEIKRRLELPSTGWLRRYRVRVHGTLSEEQIEALRAGLTVDGIEYQPMEVALDRVVGANAWFTIGLREGKNREIRRAMEHLGAQVSRLIRISYGPFQLGDLPVGEVEEVRPRVVRDQLGLKPPEAEPSRRRKGEGPAPQPAAPRPRPARPVLAPAGTAGARVARAIRPRGAPPRPGRPGSRGAERSGEDPFPRQRTWMRKDGPDAAPEAASPPGRTRRDGEGRGQRSSGAGRGAPGGEERPRQPRSAGYRSHRDGPGTSGERPRQAAGRRSSAPPDDPGTPEARPRRIRAEGDRAARKPRAGGARHGPRPETAGGRPGGADRAVERPGRARTPERRSGDERTMRPRGAGSGGAKAGAKPRWDAQARRSRTGAQADAPRPARADRPDRPPPGRPPAGGGRKRPPGGDRPGPRRPRKG
ncbi:pseudouridine synthase [Rubellimicrobium sp. CFH 75288]|uniref:pseudouridine synthase n=1 Tax=Rubellimicrobium sp. CFH 75288 TaxID=2697034 RepID=UPI00141236B9|nr:pseudouridine synthase [Rubellimicrobium sp. CFH 75288]NAZ36529.1 pseudouridine synthase [Rubellimicrobium sp. CFH 75288]